MTTLPFQPHMTVASCAGPQAHERAHAESGGLGLSLAGRIGAIEVAALAGGRLREVAQVPLGSGPGWPPGG